MTNHNTLELKTINDLLGLSFYIPAYQRGYRWTSRQVTELLEDVYEFCNRKLKQENEFYCLQPVVVKRRGEQWELVDGQQRLTTIFLILSYFNGRFSEDFRRELYSLEYETRPESREYLLNLDPDKNDLNIDFHFAFNAYTAIRTWFEDKKHRINDIESVFLNQVKVIWYQLSDVENATDVFTRLNMGKIPLVNAELVKALFLKSGNFADSNQLARHLQQLNIAQEWDAIEKRLQDDSFWYFLSNEDIKSNRIEFVLSLAARRLNSEGISDSDKLKVFLQFNNLFKTNDKKIDVVREWLKVKQCFMSLEEWYQDKGLFHLIGYLVSQKTSIESIFDLSERCQSKHEFRHSLLKLIFDKNFKGVSLEESSIEFIDSELSELNYETDSRKIRSLLLLFNIASLLANPITNSRFQFDKFKQDRWDIEHIRSVASDIPADKASQIKWLKNVHDYLSDEEVPLDANSGGVEIESVNLKHDIANLFERGFDDDEFQLLYFKIIKACDPGSNEAVDNSIGNLTLLDSGTNRSYKNAIFPIKRSKIIALDKKATFVPLCTKNVFLKYYSKHVDKMLLWEERDSQDYKRSMVECIHGLFEGIGVHS